MSGLRGFNRWYQRLSAEIKFNCPRLTYEAEGQEVDKAICNLYTSQFWESFSFTHPPSLFDPNFTQTQRQTVIINGEKEPQSESAD